jgi:hypothetical protein
MRLTLTLLLLALATPVAAQDAVRFNLECKEFIDPDTLMAEAVHEFSVDLETMTVCRRRNPRCNAVVRHGRFLELGYTFESEGQHYEVFRLYDPQSGWLTQIMRVDRNVGRTYGDAVCEVKPFASVVD